MVTAMQGLANKSEMKRDAVPGLCHGVGCLGTAVSHDSTDDKRLGLNNGLP